MSKSPDWIKRIEKDIAPMECGYYHYFPSNGGGLSANDLRIIADHLDKMNESWDNDVDEFFKRIEQNVIPTNPNWNPNDQEQ